MKSPPLIHAASNFERQTLEQRQQEFGFKNLPRLETFLWNLEIYLHIQRALKDRVALKGGAAVQLHLPIQYQRTSIDIDMVCSAPPEEIEASLRKIEDTLEAGDDDVFRFRRHTPIEPKTELPLLTYKMLFPTVCSAKELRQGPDTGLREMKVEFFPTDHLEIQVLKAPQVFAVETNHSYQILTLDALLGDKLTTLGPNTVGIPDSRSDEQMKQIYDIDALLVLRSKDFNYARMEAEFHRRAEEEAAIRSISFDRDVIDKDIIAQMTRLSRLDIDGDQNLKRLINNFQSLYLNAQATRGLAEWAITGARISLLVRSVAANCIERVFFLAGDLSTLVRFEHVPDPRIRGQIAHRFQEEFANRFAASRAEAKVLKGKRPDRILWALFSPENCAEIADWIESFIKTTA